MSFDGADNCWKPADTFDVSRERRLKVAQFGDGYQQRTIDGLHSMMTTWSLTFDTRPSEVVLAMDAYLADLEGHAFPFLDPASGETVQVFCDKWSYNWEIKRSRGGVQSWYGTLQAQFTEAFGVAV